jgi:hypothetical protein
VSYVPLSAENHIRRPTDSPHSWAILRADEEFPIEKSGEQFRTQLLAKMAGGKIMRRLEYQSEEAFRKAKR